jgi:hypothetical protein
MKRLTIILTNKKLTMEYINNLFLSRYLLYKDGLSSNPRGNILNVMLSIQSTRFDFTFHLQLRKKLRKKDRNTENVFFVTEEMPNGRLKEGGLKKVKCFNIILVVFVLHLKVVV